MPTRKRSRTIHNSNLGNNNRTQIIVAVITTTGVVLVALFAGLWGYLRNNNNVVSSSTPTPVIKTTGPTATSTPPALYTVDFAQGRQGWDGSSEWVYQDGLLQSDGSLPCCSGGSLGQIVIPAPYQVPTNDYTVEGVFRVTGLNPSQHINPNQPPYFGFYTRGAGLNYKGYEVVILGIPIGEPNAKATLGYTVLGVGQSGFDYHQEGEPGGYVLNEGWHTYDVTVQGTEITLQVDGNTQYTIFDPTYATGQVVGIEDYALKLQIGRFTVKSAPQTLLLKADRPVVLSFPGLLPNINLSPAFLEPQRRFRRTAYTIGGK